MAVSPVPLLHRFNPRRHLQVRLALATAGVTLLLALLLSWLAGSVSSLQLAETMQNSLSELAYQMADKLDRSMFERYRDIQIAAELDLIRDRTIPASRRRELLETLQRTYPTYAWIGLTDPQGVVLVSTDRLLEQVNVAERPWFQQGRLAPFVGDVHEALLLAQLLPKTGSEPLRFVDVAVPIKDDQGNFSGVLGAHLSWDWAKEIQQSLLAPIDQHRQVEIFIVDRQGAVLLQPPGGQETRLEGATSSRNGAYLMATASSRGYRNYPGLGWQIYVRQPKVVALAPARALQHRVLLGGMLLGFCFATWSGLRSRRIVDPILRLANAANAIKQGHLEVAIPTFRRQDEIAVLSQSLRHLVDTTEQQRQSLLQVNQQLQEELHRQQQNEATIREQAALLNIATDAIVVRDLDGKIQFWNAGAERLYGWSAADVHQQNANTLLNQGNTPQLAQAIETVLSQGEWQGELPKLTKSGQERIVISRWSLVRNPEGHPKAILSVDTDITEKKQMEQQLLRTQRLENLGMLASGIAHDLNNIFTPILMAAQLLPLKLPNLALHDRRLVDTLDSSARRGSSLVRQILSFARGLEGERSPVQVRHILSEVRQITASTFNKAITLELQIQSGNLWMVNADANQLHQALMNLCVNAQDAMPAGGKLILRAQNQTLSEADCATHDGALPGHYVVVTVADTGVGMPAEIVERIFAPFFTTKAIGKGTGLGLSTTLGIIKSHGGFVQVDSEVGQGTQFHLYIPAEPDQEEAEVSVEPLITGHGELLLLVDDETRIVELTRSSLEAHNYRVMTSCNGFEAIERYSQNQSEIQLVLTDIMMPDMDGHGLIRVLQILNPDLKIVAVSGSKQLTKEELGVAGFLPKPYTLEDLLKTVYQALHND